MHKLRGDVLIFSIPAPCSQLPWEAGELTA
jgi:hypothetical protein